jgi:phosphatidylserine decarboxylase
MTIHREGYLIIFISLLLGSAAEFAAYYLYVVSGFYWLFILLSLLILTILVSIVQFFRIPKRTCKAGEWDVICPADGKIVVIEEVEETEYIHGRCKQISIFMSPLNVHANYYPVNGIVRYVKYHPGLFLVAWHPKSSTDNERTTVVVEHPSGVQILFRQIAGAMARRICYYASEGEQAITGNEFGFIKFGSRVDVFLPLDAKLNVQLGDVVKGKLTKLAELNQNS